MERTVVTVDFMIIGAQKCGTTTLFDLLERHPQLCGCRDKEPHFFSTTENWRRELAAYEDRFPDLPGGRRFEASTSYTFLPHRRPAIWEDLHAYNPALRLVYLVRDPVARIVSAYMHDVLRGYTRAPLEQAVLRDPRYLDISRYATQIRPFIQRFGSNQVLILDFDDLVHHQARTLQILGRFLGFDPDLCAPPPQVHANPSLGMRKLPHRLDRLAFLGPGLRRTMPGVHDRLSRLLSRPAFREKPVMAPRLRRAILDMLALEMEALEPLLGKHLGHWRHEPGQIQ